MLTEAELADRWGMSPKSLQHWRIDGRGPVYTKLSKNVRYAIEDILQYERDRRRAPKKSGTAPTGQLVVLKEAPPQDSDSESSNDLSDEVNHRGDPVLITSEEAASVTKLPAYFFNDKEFREQQGIPHYYIGQMVRFKLDEIRQWELSKVISAFGISADRNSASDQELSPEVGSEQKFTFREALLHLAKYGHIGSKPTDRGHKPETSKT